MSNGRMYPLVIDIVNTIATNLPLAPSVEVFQNPDMISEIEDTLAELTESNVSVFPLTNLEGPINYPDSYYNQRMGRPQSFTTHTGWGGQPTGPSPAFQQHPAFQQQTSSSFVIGKEDQIEELLFLNNPFTKHPFADVIVDVDNALIFVRPNGFMEYVFTWLNRDTSFDFEIGSDIPEDLSLVYFDVASKHIEQDYFVALTSDSFPEYAGIVRSPKFGLNPCRDERTGKSSVPVIRAKCTQLMVASFSGLREHRHHPGVSPEDLRRSTSSSSNFGDNDQAEEASSVPDKAENEAPMADEDNQ